MQGGVKGDARRGSVGALLASGMWWRWQAAERGELHAISTRDEQVGGAEVCRKQRHLAAGADAPRQLHRSLASPALADERRVKRRRSFSSCQFQPLHLSKQRAAAGRVACRTEHEGTPRTREVGGGTAAEA